jgi:hypothetical protein
MNYEVMTVEQKPLDISPYCKSIFGKCSKTLVMSATILNHKAFCRSVGLLPPDQVKFIQVKSDFPVEHRPIYPLNIAYLNYNNLQAAEVKSSIARAVENIMSMHRNDKGIIHTTSYSQGHTNYTTINSNRTAELGGLSYTYFIHIVFPYNNMALQKGSSKNKRFKEVFRIDPLPIRGYQKAAAIIVLLSVLTYQIMVYYNCKTGNKQPRVIKHMLRS